MRAFTAVTSRAIPLPVDNVDTDQIIPARFLTTTTRHGLGDALFADWRHEGGPFARLGFQLGGARVLVAGNNFGCGSSREHAVWALLDFGIDVVIATAFADIFHANALRNGLVAVVLEREVHGRLLELLARPRPPAVTVDLERQRVSCDALQAGFDFDPFARHCITRGLDELGYLVERLPAIEEYEAHHPARVFTLGGCS